MGNFILRLLSAILIYCFFHFKLWKKEKWGFLKIFKSKTRSIPSGGGGGGFTPNNETNENEFVNHYDETLKEEIKSTVNRAKKTGDQIDETGEQSVTRSKKRKETSF